MTYWAGIDLGSVSLKLVVIDKVGALRYKAYRRTEGRPLPVLINLFKEVADPFIEFNGLVVTGSGRDLLSSLLGADSKNEIIAQAIGSAVLTSEAKTIIEIGGQDSKLIYISRDSKTGQADIIDHSLNEVCAAGTGSFLDQQAARLNISIEELGQLAAKSKNPCNVAGRCAVFAKSDMMHLQQEGAAREDILAGLCLALSRNFIASVGKGRKFLPPINFQGGVAANPAVIRSFESLLGIESGSIHVPPHFKVMGAYGAATCALQETSRRKFFINEMISQLADFLNSDHDSSLEISSDQACFEPLNPPQFPGLKEPPGIRERSVPVSTSETEVFLGVDIGSASAKFVLIDQAGDIVFSTYVMTGGSPAKAVTQSMTAIGREIGKGLKVLKVGVTGSGRYFTGPIIGADVVVNEITAQAKAALTIDPDIDTLIEIGGQDSKFVTFKNGIVTDFEMNKVCAAGTGSFLQEQAARLDICMEKGFEQLSYLSRHPSDLGTRCTVFMESDLIHHQQRGKKKEDLVSGLAYAIVMNYMDKVIGNRKIGNNIHFQGGVASNGAVVSAMEKVLKKKVTVSRHHSVTGAIGAALRAREMWRSDFKETCFNGFDLDRKQFLMNYFNCTGCSNVCKISQIKFDNGTRARYGGICDKHDTIERGVLFNNTLDLIDRRNELMFACLELENVAAADDRPVIGLPRTLFFFDHLPLWYTFLNELGFRVVLSSPTSKELFYLGLRENQAEACHPVKLAYGHIIDLLDKGVEQIFFPCEVELPKVNDDLARTHNCPYMQGAPYIMKAVFKDRAKFITPAIYMSGDRENLYSIMRETAAQLRVSKEMVKKAIPAANKAQRRFLQSVQEEGKAIVSGLKEQKAIIVLGKSHHLYDEGQNMHISKILRKLGVLGIPFDFLPLSGVTLPQEFSNIVWRNTQDLLRAAVIAKELNLPCITLTNFGCGPDSFTLTYLEEILDGYPHLVIEVDDHSAEAGIVTRIEAFLDTIKQSKPTKRLDFSKGLETIVWRRKDFNNFFSPSYEFMKALEGRTLYVPYVSPGMTDVLAAAFKAADIDARVLPPQDARSDELGNKYAAGTECHPFLATLGGFLKLTEQSDFDPDGAAFFIFTNDCACRFSQYPLGYKIAMKRLGLESIPIFGPMFSTRYDEFTGLLGLNVSQALWKGWVAAEILDRYLYAIRPYEQVPGQTDEVYLSGIDGIAKATATFSPLEYFRDQDLIKALRRAILRMKTVPLSRNGSRPKIGVLGEWFTVLNSNYNYDMIRMLEQMGVEVKVHGFTVTNCVLLYAERFLAREKRHKKQYLASMYHAFRRDWMLMWTERLERELDDCTGDLKMLHEDEIINNINGLIHDDIDAVASTFVARMTDFMRLDISGVSYMSVLNCMLSNMMLPVLGRIASSSEINVPVLPIVFDSSQETNIKTRLEAFVAQAKCIHERYYAS